MGTPLMKLNETTSQIFKVEKSQKCSKAMRDVNKWDMCKKTKLKNQWKFPHLCPTESP
jgi:hypothetical protein